MSVVLYRGPWQGRRLDFLCDAIVQAHGEPLDFVWLDPRAGDDIDRKRTFHRSLRTAEALRSFSVLDGRGRAACAGLAALRGRLPRPVDQLYAIGFTSLPFAHLLPASGVVWCVNGIPEERLLYDDSARNRAVVAGLWRLVRLGRRPDAAIVVSERMGRLVSERLGGVSWIKAPTSSDLAVFAPPPSAPPRGVLTYLGTAAPWQNLTELGAVWAELHRSDPALRFRVISRDPRASVLVNALPDDACELVRADSPAEVARLLWEARAGFLLRAAHIVNTVSYPTKVGEYLGAGAPVVTSGLDWDVSDLVREQQCGVLVPPGAPPSVAAAHVRQLLEHPPSERRCREAALELDRGRWLEHLLVELRRLAPHAPARPFTGSAAAR